MARYHVERLVGRRDRLARRGDAQGSRQIGNGIAACEAIAAAWMVFRPLLQVPQCLFRRLGKR